MKAQLGDRLHLAASAFDAPTRDGEVLEVGGEDGEPPYLVRWADGRLCPEPGSVQRVEYEHEHTALAKVILLSNVRASRSRT